MIKLPNVRLPGEISLRLNEWQAEVDIAGDYVGQVTAAKKLFDRYSSRKEFATIRQSLARMCSGPRRCCYCEDSVADEVEHIRPKHLYPSLVFAWINYLYSCGRCNGGKRERFAVYTRTGEYKDITRPRNAPVLPPIKGKPVLIDPRREDAIQWLQLDLQLTFDFAPRFPRGTAEYERARYTIDVLKLNDREELQRARRRAYENYRARLVEYIKHIDSKSSRTKLKSLRDGLKQESHPTVWAEMKRQHSVIKELNDLFTQAPEALNW